MVPNKVKMVIWDLDDTFWHGTLTEGSVAAIEANLNIVRVLARRGIISSIVSKNDAAPVEAKLKELDIWDFFVFPRIAFAPKGQVIAALIDEVNLRAENVLFIDDNILNLQEAKHYSPDLMTADPVEILPKILDLPELAGKDDPELTRLSQYRLMEVRNLERSTQSGDNDEFLRQCDIRLSIDYDFKSNIDRIVELANRSNQLNYTKHRLETPAAVDKFLELCGSYGVSVGVVRVRDRYGDYGIVGFFVRRLIAVSNELIHFVFSCRIMNMGVEQYLYEQLKKPKLTIAQPVSSSLTAYDKVTWIKEEIEGESAGRVALKGHSLLIGGCELLQVASVCSASQDEFVNLFRDSRPIRFDDAGFILTDRTTIRRDKHFENLKYWSAQDAARFDAALGRSNLVIAALYGATEWNYFESESGVLFRLERTRLIRILKENGLWFVRQFRPVRMTVGERLEQVARSLDRIAKMTPKGTRLFALGVNTKLLSERPVAARAGVRPRASAVGALREGPAPVGKILAARAPSFSAVMQMSDAGSPLIMRECFNTFLKQYCEGPSGFVFVDVDHLVSESEIQKPDPATGKRFPDHFTRQGYMNIASFIASHVSPEGSSSGTESVKAAEVRAVA